MHQIPCNSNGPVPDADHAPTASSVLQFPLRGRRRCEARTVTVQPFRPPTFRVDDPAALEYLEENGYAVFSGVANCEDLGHGVTLFWRHVTRAARSIRRDDPSTWTDRNGWPGYKNSGVIPDWGIGTSAFLWHCRSLPNVRRVFELIWSDRALLTSLDGCGAFRPPEVPEYRTDGGWFHVDQNYRSKPEKICVQGLLNFFPSGPNDGGLTLLPGSHRLFRELPSECWQHMSDFVMLNYADLDLLWGPNARSPVKLNLEPGEFAVWDSRTVHCNSPALSQPAASSSSANQVPAQLRRLVAYVCMVPTRFCRVGLQQLRERRRKAHADCVTTSHWPIEFVPTCDPFRTRELPAISLTKDLTALLYGVDPDSNDQ